jgi:hypothetical protein
MSDRQATSDIPPLTWEPAVALVSTRDAALPDDVEATAFSRSVSWFRDQALYSIDWKKGVIEGFEAGIDHRGRQLRRLATRRLYRRVALVYGSECRQISRGLNQIKQLFSCRAFQTAPFG